MNRIYRLILPCLAVLCGTMQTAARNGGQADASDAKKGAKTSAAPASPALALLNPPAIDLRTGFAAPPASAKARTWWHWINGNVSKAGITADLEAMKRIGIQEAQIFNVDQGYPEGTASYLTDEWLECFRFAVAEAERLGMEVGFHNGAGWSSSGGPWVTPEGSMQTVVYSESHFAGKQKVREKLPQPASKLGWYRDIAVYAFPTPKGGERIENLAWKSLSGDSFKHHLYPDAKQVDAASVVRAKDIIDLTGRMAADGTLEWTVPAGEWTVIRFGHTTTGTENRPAGIGGRGLECNKLSRQAVDAYWDAGVQPILDKVGDLAGKTLVNCVIDSYEVGCGNWTPGFEGEFRARQGYDCMPFFPALAGYYVDSGERTERFLWDFRRTVGDLTVDNYYGYFGELCHKHGLQFSTEPYGGPFEAMKAGTKGDIVMSEFWIGRTEYLDSPKMVASIAHLSGKPYVGAESFTSIGGWINHPATIKKTGDWVWTEGINRFLFHSYTHQPWDVAPGMTFHQYGFDLNRHNTWWEQGKPFMDYIARSQFLLQQGRCAADVLVYAGEASPSDGALRADIKALGYDYDQIGTVQMHDLTVEDGWIRTPVGGRYRLLVLPATEWMSPEMSARIGKLVADGAAVLGSAPLRSPSLAGYPACDTQVARTASGFRDGLMTGLSVKEALTKLELAPDFSGGASGSDLNFIHRITPEADVYFVANPQKEAREIVCRFRATGSRPQLWNAQTGEVRDAAVWQEQGDGTTAVPIAFESEGSWFVVFPKVEAAGADHLVSAAAVLDARAPKPLDGLEIVEARYGVFLPDGMVDVTDVLNGRIEGGKLSVSAGNDLTGFDPASGSVKELRVAYETAGGHRVARALESTPLTIDVPEGVRIIRAVYGKFPLGMDGVPEKLPEYDAAPRIAAMIAANELVIPVDDRLADGKVPADGRTRELRAVYTAGGETHRVTAAQGRSANFTAAEPESELTVEGGRVVWITPYAGRLNYMTASGKSGVVQAAAVPEAVELTGKWNVTFPKHAGASERAVYDKLTSWTASPDDGIRHFSGTAVYRTQFTLSEELFRPGQSLEIDLGSVKVIAEVIVNGRNLGVLWRAPFRVELGDAVHAGTNELEVRVTNLWPNRLIGDDRLPADFEWGDFTLKSWPEWLVGETPRESERVTFTTWKHWTKDDALLSSGLLGPVVIRPYVHVEVAGE